jgi:hypothetical protein
MSSPVTDGRPLSRSAQVTTSNSLRSSAMRSAITSWNSRVASPRVRKVVERLRCVPDAIAQRSCSQRPYSLAVVISKSYRTRALTALA